MIYDCFTFFNELDLLEIRLNVLDPYVDYFVICESHLTFSGKEKPLYFLENKERFSKWKDKIIHIEAGRYSAKDSFDQAHFQKELLKHTVGEFAKDDDIVYFGDLDEIWKPQEVDDRVYKLKQLNYSYFLNNRSTEAWIGTIVGKWKSIKEKGFNWNRANPENYKEDGGWHFTNIGGAEQVIKKLEAYDHQEFNTPDIKESIKEKIENGQDYVGRSHDWQGRAFGFWTDESDLPKYLKDNKEKWIKLFR